MKKIFFLSVVVFISFVLFFGSCWTPSSNKSDRLETSWISNSSQINSNLGKNEIAFRDNPAGLPEGVETNLFGRLSWFNSMLEMLDLHETLAFDEKETLFDALFGFIPAGPTNDYYREVSIGGYFEDGKPLSLYGMVYKPSARAPEGSVGIFELSGNFWVVRNNKTGIVSRERIVTVGSRLNWSTNGVIFSDNSIVRAAHLYSQEKENEIKKEYGDNRYLQYVNLADIYIKDQITENDDRALEILNEAYANATEMPIRIVAKLNTFLYYLSKENINNAEEALTIATRLSKELADIDPSFRRVIDIEAPTMLQIYKNNM